ncbi:MAG TPA: hypothetical protein VIM37_01055 [Candidatus Microsaccharimonas sp.]|jgi:hypothetical protein
MSQPLSISAAGIRVGTSGSALSIFSNITFGYSWMVLTCYVAFGSVVMACSIYTLARGERARKLEMSPYYQEATTSEGGEVDGIAWLTSAFKRDEPSLTD